MHCEKMLSMSGPCEFPLSGITFAMAGFNVLDVFVVLMRSVWRLPQWLFLFTLVMGCQGSIDEAVLNHFQQGQLAQLPAQNTAYADRWTWVERHIGLLRPSAPGGRHMMIHRTTNSDEFPLQQTLAVQLADDAVDTILAIEQIWDGLGPYRANPTAWIINPVDPAVRASLLPQDREHWILVSRGESRRFPSHEPVMLEIRWESHRSSETIAFALWLPQLSMKMTILQALGLLRACGTTHACALHCNGAPADHVALTLRYGDFLLVHGRPSELRIDDEELDSVAEVDAHGTELLPLTDQEPLSLLCHTVTYKPTSPANPSPLHISSVLTSRESVPHDEILLAWPDLQHQQWHLIEVHETYYEQFMHETYRGCFVARLVWGHLSAEAHLPAKLALLVITWDGMTYSKARYFENPITKQSLLQQSGLSAICSEHYHICDVRWNGEVVDEHPLHQAQNGQYVHIDLDLFSRISLSTLLDQMFQVMSAASGFEHVDSPIFETFVDIAQGHASDVVSAHAHRGRQALGIASVALLDLDGRQDKAPGPTCPCATRDLYGTEFQRLNW